MRARSSGRGLPGERRRRPHPCLLLVGGLLLLAGGPALAVPSPEDAPDPGPRITFSETVFDFGDVPVGETVEHVFTIHNRGTGVLTVLDVKPACDCTVTEFDSIIPPGGSGKLVAGLVVRTSPGRMAKTITVRSNDPETPSAVLLLQANARAFVEIKPSPSFTFTVGQGEGASKRFQVTATEEGPFEITGVEVASPHLTAAATPVPGNPRQYLVTVELAPTAPPGPVRGVVRIHTTSVTMPELRVQCRGEVLGQIHYAPRQAIFGRLRPDGTSPSGAARTVAIHLNLQTEGAFTITRVEASHPQIAHEVTTRRAGRSYSVLCSYRSGLPPGPFQGTMKIYTDVPEMPVIAVPYQGTILDRP